MKKLFGIATSLAFLALIAFVLYAFVLPWRVKVRLDEAIETVSPFAEIGYGRVETELGGRLRLVEPVVAERGGDRSLRAEHLTVDFGGTLNLIEALVGSLDNFPDRFGVRLKAIELRGPRAEGAPQLASGGWPRACGAFPQTFTVATAERPLDLSVSLIVEPGGSVEAALDVLVAGFTRDYATLRISGLNREIPERSNPQLRYLQLEHDDLGALKALVAQCIQASNADRATVLGWFVDAAGDQLGARSDERLNAATRDELQAYLDQPGTLLLTGKPTGQIDSVRLNTEGSLPLLREIEFTLTVGDRSDVTIGFEPRPESAASGADSGADHQSATDSAGAPAARERRPTLRTIGYDAMGDHVGRIVEFEATDGRIYRGRLIDDGLEAIGIEQRYEGGRWTYYPSPETTRRITLLR
ncbi:MAG: hypothetical protein KDG50_06210 [Chromatiales bacterium]|nr:hypothetical protein [Chromatiales bacterium]